MRRLARHLFTLCSAGSLLLLVVTCAVSVRSSWAVDTFSQIRWDAGTGRHSQSGVAWERGRLFGYYRAMEVPPGRHYAEFRLPAPRRWHAVRPVRSGDFEFTLWEAEFSGAGGGGAARGVFDRSWQAGVALWPLIPVSAVLPATWIVSRLRARRARALGLRLCTACGYDLRASPDRCPECGTAVVEATA